MSKHEVLSVCDVHKSFGGNDVLKGVSVSAREAELLVVCGLPSTGKTTLARIICGLEQVDRGRMFVGGRDVSDLKPGVRDIGYVPQSFALFPNLSVHKNIAYPLSRDRQSKSQIAERVGHMAQMLGIDDLLEKRVDQISGGQKQRVAIARGLVKKCSLYVLDDPLVGLDFKLREQLILDLRLLQKRQGASFLYLTGDPLEPLVLGDSVAVLADGVIKEVTSAVKAYKSPDTDAMARVLGLPRANFIDASATPDGTGVSCGLFDLTLTNSDRLPDSVEHLRLVVRPEHIDVSRPDEDALSFSADVRLVEDIGADSIIHLQTAVGRLVACRPSARIRPSHDELLGSIDMWVRPHMIRAYDTRSGRFLDYTFGMGER